MAKLLRCRDVGIDYGVRGRTEEEVLRKAAEQGPEYHNVRKITPEKEQQIRAAIRED